MKNKISAKIAIRAGFGGVGSAASRVRSGKSGVGEAAECGKSIFGPKAPPPTAHAKSTPPPAFLRLRPLWKIGQHKRGKTLSV